MQAQRCEVRVENDEYEREQQCLVQQIKCVVVLRNYHILAARVLCGAIPRSHPRNSFNVVRALCPPHNFHTSTRVGSNIDNTVRMCTVLSMVQRSLRCAREAHTANTYTQYMFYPLRRLTYLLCMHVRSPLVQFLYILFNISHVVDLCYLGSQLIALRPAEIRYAFNTGTHRLQERAIVS